MREGTCIFGTNIRLGWDWNQDRQTQRYTYTNLPSVLLHTFLTIKSILRAFSCALFFTNVVYVYSLPDPLQG